MTSLRQIETNRRNALKRTGPKTRIGKQQSRRNAVRHGLTAETVIDVLEDPEDHKAFELAVAAGFDAQTAVERELVLRLATLLWRLRRATAIETGLFQIASDINDEFGKAKSSDASPPENVLPPLGRVEGLESVFRQDIERYGNGHDDCLFPGQTNSRQGADSGGESLRNFNSDVASRFLQLAKLDISSFDRLSRYETALWRQVYQVTFMLDFLRRQNLDLKWLGAPGRRRAPIGLPCSVFPRPNTE